MVSIAQLRELTSLNLDFTNVTDAGARHLEPLKNLRTLSLIRGNISRQGRKGLEEAIPGLATSIED